MLDQHQTPSLSILVSPDTLEGARRSIHGCEVCSNNAVVPFAQVLDRLTGHFDPEREYVLDEDLECPSCSTLIDSYTLVELQSITAHALATAHA